MKNLMLLVSIFFMVFLVGCATPTNKDWVATGGSKADGIIRLSIEYSELEKPVVDDEQALKVAIDACEVWGYTSARAFGGSVSQCTGSSGWTSCSRYVMTKEYQCMN